MLLITHSVHCLMIRLLHESDYLMIKYLIDPVDAVTILQIAHIVVFWE